MTQHRQQSYIDAEGALHENGDIYTVAHLYSPEYYADQNPIILARKSRAPDAEVARASRVSRRTTRFSFHPMRAVMAWIAQWQTSQSMENEELIVSGLEEE